ncbi:MAG: hypothetical protein HZA77_10705 [Candidatus Schekmanbacteria bacterium]|nr:hypothetical protein [Candidatus Schekmanbacteria bacterium]
MTKRKTITAFLICFILFLSVDVSFAKTKITKLTSKYLIGEYTQNVVWKTVVVNDIAYLAAVEGGLVILDISDQSSPHLLGTYKEDNSDILDVFVENGIAYIADANNGFEIIDVSNPESPTLLGSYNTGSARQIYVSNGIAFVHNWYGNLDLIDISNPSAPTLLGSVDAGNQPGGIYVSGNYAYVGDNEDGGRGFQIIDISDPSSPSVLGQTGGCCSPLMYYKGFFYIDLCGEINKVDVSNPSSPTITAIFHGMGSSGEPFTVYDDKLYYYTQRSDGLVGIWVIDLLSSKATELYKVGGMQQIQFSNGAMYLSYITGLEIYDLKPASISALSRDTCAPGSKLTVNGKKFGADAGKVIVKQGSKNYECTIISWSNYKIVLKLSKSLKSGKASIRVIKSTGLKSENNKTINIKK